MRNSDRLHSLMKNGKLMLSLNDAVALAMENNFDIAIARYNLDIADMDVLRTKSGGTIRGVSTGLGDRNARRQCGLDFDVRDFGQWLRRYFVRNQWLSFGFRRIGDFDSERGRLYD